MKEIMIAALLLLITSCTSNIQNDSLKADHIVDTTNVADSVKRILSNWRQDSIGCLRLRNIDDGILLVQAFNLDTASREDVIRVLGRPNDEEINDEWVDGITYEDCLILTYYCWSACVDITRKDMIRPMMWMVVAITTNTNRVVHVRTAMT